VRKVPLLIDRRSRIEVRRYLKQRGM